MQLTVVGSGTAAPEAERAASCYALEAGSSLVLLDCGPGALHNMARFDVPWHRITHLCLTHFHTDHVGDVPALLFALRYGRQPPRKEPLVVLGPRGLRRFFRRLAAAFGEYIEKPGFPLELVEMQPGVWLPIDDVARLSATPTPHTDASVAFRIERADRALGYTGDTGYDVDVGAFFQHVDLLIAECSLPDDLAMESHLTPSRVAALARVALPRRLLLTHMYPQLDRGGLIDRIREAGWAGEMVIAEDGRRFTVPGVPAASGSA